MIAGSLLELLMNHGVGSRGGGTGHVPLQPAERHALLLNFRLNLHPATIVTNFRTPMAKVDSIQIEFPKYGGFDNKQYVYIDKSSS